MISNTSGPDCASIVLGGSGRLGAMLRAFWGDDPHILWHSTQDKPDFVVFDLILDPEKAIASCPKNGTVICLAGVTPARLEAKKQVFSGNTDLACAAINAAHQAGARRVFVASSAAVYGAEGGVLRETDALHPVSEYGQAKAQMEQAALNLAHDLGLPVTLLRIGNVAGADAILGGWRAGMQIDQLPDGTTPQRSYIGPRLLAQVLRALTRVDEVPEVLNIAARGAVQMGALLDAAGLPWTPRQAPQDVIGNVTLDTTRLEALVPLPKDAGTAPALVAEWRAFQDRSPQT